MASIFDLFRSIEKPQEGTAPISWLVVGLGNPGKEYENTRHNAGFVVLDALAAMAGADVCKLKDRALLGEGVLAGVRVLFMKPQTFMNLSGEAVAAAASFYKIPPSHILVLCDDVNFEVGFLRLRKKGSAGGHNGLKSIIACLGSDDFPRLKIGVGQKPAAYDLADWVLGHFSKEQAACLQKAAATAAEAVTLWVGGKENEAQNLLSTQE